MRTEDKHLVRTDDEVQLLLETTRDFKAKKAYVGVEKHKGQLSKYSRNLCVKSTKAGRQ